MENGQKLRSGVLLEPVRRNGISYFDPNPGGFPCVLLLHGLGVDGSSWEYQLRGLAEGGARPIAPDLPGFGCSEPIKNWSIASVAARIMDLMRELSKVPFMLVGLSLGGVLALHMAFSQPASITRLALLSTFACLRPANAGAWIYLARRFILANLLGPRYQAELVAARIFPYPNQFDLRQALVERIQLADPRNYQEAISALALFDARRNLTQINLPTLVVSGVNDSTVPVELQSQLCKGIHGARHIVVPNAGHAVIVDQPERVNKILLDFFLTDHLVSL